MKFLTTPIQETDIEKLQVGDIISISGYIYTGRDAVLPKVVKLIEDNAIKKHNIDLEGAVVFHTAVSPAGVGPTSSNKLEIESTFETLSKNGVRLHLGKGAIKQETVKLLNENNSVFAIIPPVTALLGSKTEDIKCIYCPELGMEALYRIKVNNYQAIIASAKGESIYE